MEYISFPISHLGESTKNLVCVMDVTFHWCDTANATGICISTM